MIPELLTELEAMGRHIVELAGTDKHTVQIETTEK
jgi:hypothetical protein